MAKTAAPSGLTLTRKNGTFTAAWKIAAKDYGDGQAAQYRLGKGKWTSISVGTGTTKKSFSVSTANYYPTSGKKTLPNVAFRVRGNSAGAATTVSDWTTKTFTFAKPAKPNVTVTVGEHPRSTFAWSVATKDDNTAWFTSIEYTAVLVKDSNVTDGSKINWNSTEGQRYTSTGGATGSLTVTEDSGQLADGHSYTRWFRVRSRGVGGASDWRYAKHVYAMPNQMVVTDYKVSERADRNGYVCKIWYNVPFSASKPIDTLDAQYALAKPDAGLVCPSEASWQSGLVSVPKDRTAGAAFSIDNLLGADQCLFVRVNATYDNRTTYGAPVLVDAGDLAAPSNLSVVTDDTQHTATVTVTNNSTVADSFVVVRYMSADDPNGFDIGIIPHGSNSVVVQCPAWESTTGIAFGAYAVVGSYEATTRADGVTSYAVTPVMESAMVVSGGSVPAAPANVAVSATPTPGTIRVTWDWSWSEADSAELSWADHDDAWESTDEPSTYTISKMHASAWNISGLQTGQKWYIRVRLIAGTGDAQTFGAYSDMVELDLSTAPAIPVIVLGNSVITETGTVNASWSYATTDGTGQTFAEVAEVTEENSETVYTTIAETQTAQSVAIDAESVGWASGETHALAVRVTSESGRMSEWSDPVSVTIAEPITCTITQTSLGTDTIESTDEQGDPVTYTVTSLNDLPLTVTVTGAGASGTTSVMIERAADYHVDRPDESAFNGYAGETIALFTQQGEGEISIALDDLIGSLDDGAAYTLIASVYDALGQSAQASIDFEVHWTQQALVPEATVTIDDSNMIAILTPIAPAGAAATDVCDIYRLSTDKPELVYRGAEFGTAYVDPFPTIGDTGGHRFVLRTATGDYITDTEQFAWVDTLAEDGDVLTSEYNVIDFGTGRAEIRYNIDLSSTWAKDFKETKYLGGAVAGDWNPATSRTGTVNATAIRTDDEELIETMRRLAAYPGICHVRTKDGSSYPADVQVQESVSVASGHKLAVFALQITRVDPEVPDGLTYAEWQETQA